MIAREPSALLILPRIRIQNANAISGPLTWGFPAPTAFTGFVHALSRRCAERLDIEFDGLGVVCHRFEPQVSQPAGKRTYTFHLTRNPLDKAGSTAAIVEEGRIHLDVSFVIGVHGPGLYSGLPREDLLKEVLAGVFRMRIAGGSVLPPTKQLTQRECAYLADWPSTAEQQVVTSRRIARNLLPGFAVVSREAMLRHHLQQLRESKPNSTALDALLDLTRLNFEPPKEASAEWTVRPKAGWLVPLPIGYAAISPLYEPAEVRNSRDKTVPFRFVESLLSLGEWLSPHRVKNICDLFWYHQSDPERGLYRCTTPAYSDLIS
jgi:CRISPR-associated protein Csy2